jgi:hypothetical protein
MKIMYKLQLQALQEDDQSAILWMMSENKNVPPYTPLLIIKNDIIATNVPSVQTKNCTSCLYQEIRRAQHPRACMH